MDSVSTTELGITPDKPKYLETIDPKTRQEMISVSSRVTESLPHSVLMGGTALRFTYEAKTGKPMLGTGKGDYDVYVPAAEITSIDQKPPQGYQVKQEPEWHKPQEGYIALADIQNNYAHIDVFGRGDGRESEEVIIDGKRIRVLTLGEQIADKSGMTFEEMLRKVIPQEAQKTRADPLVVRIANELQNIPQSDPKFKDKLRGLYLAEKIKMYPEDWSTVLNQFALSTQS